MKITDNNFEVEKQQGLYSQLRDGASFSREGDPLLYIRKNRWIAVVADYSGGFKFIKKDGMVESLWAKQIKKGEIE